MQCEASRYVRLTVSDRRTDELGTMGGAVSELRHDIHAHVVIAQHYPRFLEPVLVGAYGSLAELQYARCLVRAPSD